MSLKFCSFGSGSSGNSYLIHTENTSVLVDTGISGKRIIAGLGAFDLTPSDVDAILLTHEHSDHVLSIRMIARKAENASIYGSRGTLRSVEDRIDASRENYISRDEAFDVGDIHIEPFGLSHDASEPMSYTFSSGGRKLSLITDTGTVTEDIFSHIKGSDAMILEANHEVNVLRAGPYPFELKERILSDHGHLSNESAGEVIARLLDAREDGAGPMRVMLAHISKINNTPDMAYMTVKNVLFEHDYYVDRDVLLDVADHDVMSEDMEV